MNLPSEARGVGRGQALAGGTAVEPIPAFLAPEKSVAPFEFRLLRSEEMALDGSSGGFEDGGGRQGGAAAGGYNEAGSAAEDAARQEGLVQGEREGRRMARMELEAEMRAALVRERAGLVTAAEQFRVARERYFAEVEQEVVKLALAIAARVLHRETQIDPLLLTGAVRVALETMADRSGVVVRVADADVEAWERAFEAVEEAERPRVTADARLARGECVLDTKMGTVELGVAVQLEEIEKGFFDLLHHRPVE